jgi:hypothetical protein
MPLQAGDEAGVVHYRDEDEAPQPGLLKRPQGFLSRMSLLRPRMTEDDLIEVDGLEPELPQRAQLHLDDDIEAPDDDRVRERISDAIRSRVRQPPGPATAGDGAHGPAAPVAGLAHGAAADGRACDGRG